MSASATVVHNTYLVEMILDGMDMKDIFRLQRVSKLWLETITNSTRLQQQLFLKPLPETQAVPVDHLHKIGYCFNGKCADHTSCLHTGDKDERMVHRIDPRIISDVTYVAPHPLLFYRKSSGMWCRWHFLAARLGPFDQTHPSWMNAFVTQPPVTVASGYVSIKDVEPEIIMQKLNQSPYDIYDLQFYIEASRTDGVRFCDFFEQARNDICSLVEDEDERDETESQQNSLVIRCELHFAFAESDWTVPRYQRRIFHGILEGGDGRDAVVWWSAGNAGKAMPLQTWQVVKPVDLQGNAGDTTE